MVPPPSSPRSTPASLTRELLRAAFPLIVMNLTTTTATFVDALMIRDGGEEALAAIFPAQIMFWLPVSFMHGLLSIVTTLVSQNVGAGKPQEAGRYAMQGILLGAVAGTLMLSLWPIAEDLFAWMQHPPEIRQLEGDMLRLYLLGAPFALITAACTAFFTGILRTWIVFAAAAAGLVLNVFFNYGLIYGEFGMPEMGPVGVALGTSISYAMQAAILLTMCWGQATREKFKTWIPRWDGEALKPILRLGSPAGLLPVFDLLTWGVLINSLIAQFGTDHMAANTIVVRYIHLLFMPAVAIGQALAGVVGQCLGASRPGDANLIATRALLINAGYMLTLGVVFVIFRYPLMHVFVEDGAGHSTVEAGARIFICVAVYQFFDACFITYVHALRGAGDTKWPALALIASSSTLLVGGGFYMVTFHPELASLGPWIATAAYTVVLGTLMLMRWTSGAWRAISVVKPAEPVAIPA